MRFIGLLLFACVWVLPAQAAEIDLGAYNFSETEDEDEENKPITSHFDCYDLTIDSQRATCLDQDLSMLQNVLEGQHARKLAKTDIEDERELRKQHEKWLDDQRLKCGGDALCLKLGLQSEIVKLADGDELFRGVLQLQQGKPGLEIGVYGRENRSAYSLLFFRTYNAKGEVVQQFDFFQLLRSRDYELKHPAPKPYLVDANFDGWLDLVFLTGVQSEGISRFYFIYDPATKKIALDGKLSGLHQPIFYDEYKVIGSPWRKSDASGIDYYVYKGKKIKLDYRYVYAPQVDELGQERVLKTEYSNRTGRLVKKDQQTVRVEDIGSLPDIYTDPEKRKAAAEELNKPVVKDRRKRKRKTKK